MEQPTVTYQPGYNEKGGNVAVVSAPPQGYGMSQMGMQGYGPSPGMAGIPPGLEYISTLNRIDIYQVLHAIEFLGWERNNEYQVCNEQHQQFMLAKEQTDCCTRQMCGNLRPFTMEIRSMEGFPIISLDRPLNCQGCCYPCCMQEMEIFSPPGNKIASIHEVWSLWTPRYLIKDAAGMDLFRIEGECCYCKCCADVPFKVFRMDGQEAGEIVKHWNGCMEVCARVNNFSVIFAPGESPVNKAILLGCTFLVDFMYFELKNNN